MSKLYFINTTLSSGPQIDPCSLIPWNILHCTIAFCSSFVFWLICHYKCDMFWLCIYIISISIALLITGASTRWIQQPKANFHRHAIRFSVRTCRYTLSKLHILHTYIPLSISTPPTVPTREIKQEMVRLVAVFDDIWFNLCHLGHTQCISLHRFTHLIFCSKFRPVRGSVNTIYCSYYLVTI